MKKFLLCVISVLVCVAMLVSCAPAETSTAPSDNTSTEPTETQTQPSDSASTAPESSSATLSGNIKVVGSTSVGPLMEGLKELFEAANDQVIIDIEQVGSGPGIQAAMDGTADIGMASRDLKEDETGIDAHTLCIDGIAVIVNKDNPVKNLTAQQIKDIYMGNITNWSEVGGEDAPITVISRESTSGTRGAFEELVLGTDEAGEQIVIDDKLCLIQNSNGNIGQAVETTKDAIGYMSLGLVQNYDVHAVGVDGVEATLDNVKNGTYTLKRPFLLLTKGTPSQTVTALLDFVSQDEAAKAYIEENGYIVP